MDKKEISEETILSVKDENEFGFSWADLHAEELIGDKEVEEWN